jgi:hypothetical protein
MNVLGLLFALMFFVGGCALGAVHRSRSWSGWITVWPKRDDLHWRDAQTSSDWSQENPGMLGPYRVTARNETLAKDRILQTFYDGMKIEYRNDFDVIVSTQETRP